MTSDRLAAARASLKDKLAVESDPWLTATESAAHLGLGTPRTILRAAKRKKLKCGRTAAPGTKGAEVRFQPSALDAWYRGNAGWKA